MSVCLSGDDKMLIMVSLSFENESRFGLFILVTGLIRLSLALLHEMRLVSADIVLVFSLHTSQQLRSFLCKLHSPSIVLSPLPEYRRESEWTTHNTLTADDDELHSVFVVHKVKTMSV